MLHILICLHMINPLRRLKPGSISILLFLKFPTNKCSLLGWKIPRNKKKTDTLITLMNQSQEIRPQGLDLGRSTSIRGCTSAQIKTLRPYFSIFSITVVRICLRKQQSKFFTNMLTTPSIEPVNIWFDPAATWSSVLQFRFPNKATKLTNASSWYVNLVNCQNKWEILLNFCGFIRKLDLYHTG